MRSHGSFRKSLASKKQVDSQVPQPSSMALKESASANQSTTATHIFLINIVKGKTYSNFIQFTKNNFIYHLLVNKLSWKIQDEIVVMKENNYY